MGEIRAIFDRLQKGVGLQKDIIAKLHSDNPARQEISIQGFVQGWKNENRYLSDAVTGKDEVVAQYFEEYLRIIAPTRIIRSEVDKALAEYRARIGL